MNLQSLYERFERIPKELVKNLSEIPVPVPKHLEESSHRLYGTHKNIRTHGYSGKALRF